MKGRNIQAMIQPELKTCPGCHIPTPIGRFVGKECIFCRVEKGITKTKPKRGILGRIQRGV